MRRFAVHKAMEEVNQTYSPLVAPHTSPAVYPVPRVAYKRSSQSKAATFAPSYDSLAYDPHVLSTSYRFSLCSYLLSLNL